MLPATAARLSSENACTFQRALGSCDRASPGDGFGQLNSGDSNAGSGLITPANDSLDEDIVSSVRLLTFALRIVISRPCRLAEDDL